MDFFDRIKDSFLETGALPSAADKQEDEVKDTVSDDEDENNSGRTMTKDELYKLKMEVMPQL